MTSGEGIAKRYALALFSSAMNKEILDEVCGDMKQLLVLLETTPEFKNFLLSPRSEPTRRSS